MHKGNIKAFIHALAALYLLNLYYRNESWVTKYQEISKFDYSMGSAIFTVKPPVANQLWYGNIPTISESPYVVSYNEDDYQRIEKMQRNEAQALNDYWIKQPELHEPAFLLQMQEALEREKNDPSQRVMHIWELAKYRLNKKIPNTLTFAERKELLIKSEEWNGLIHQYKHLTAGGLTEDNIQEEIDHIGVLWGMKILTSFQKLEWLPIALNSEICKIYIP